MSESGPRPYEPILTSKEAIEERRARRERRKQAFRELKVLNTSLERAEGKLEKRALSEERYIEEKFAIAERGKEGRDQIGQEHGELAFYEAAILSGEIHTFSDRAENFLSAAQGKLYEAGVQEDEDRVCQLEEEADNLVEMALEAEYAFWIANASANPQVIAAVAELMHEEQELTGLERMVARRIVHHEHEGKIGEANALREKFGPQIADRRAALELFTNHMVYNYGRDAYDEIRRRLQLSQAGDPGKKQNQ